MLTPEQILSITTRFMGMMLIALSVNEILKRDPWLEGYTGINIYFIIGIIILVIIGMYLLIRGNIVAKAACSNVQPDLEQFSPASVIVLIVKIIGMSFVVLTGIWLLDALSFTLYMLEVEDLSSFLHTQVGSMVAKSLTVYLLILLIGCYLYFNGSLVFKILHIR